MNYLQKLIKECMEGGGLSLSDISCWIDKPIPTVRGWLLEYREPKQKNVHVLNKLEELKRLINEKPPGQFLPPGTTERNRKRLITELRDATFSVPTEGVAS